MTFELLDQFEDRVLLLLPPFFVRALRGQYEARIPPAILLTTHERGQSAKLPSIVGPSLPRTVEIDEQRISAAMCRMSWGKKPVLELLQMTFETEGVRFKKAGRSFQVRLRHYSCGNNN
jgi:hypothetical protein